MSIEQSAFEYCSALTDVYFAGTMAQANAIKLGISNTCLGAATWHCSDGDMQGVGATSGICGSSMKWPVDGSTLAITGEGEMGGFDALNPAPWTAYKDTITELNISEGVTAISADAFSGMPMLASIRLPDSLETLGQGALANYTSLSSLTIPAKIISVPDNLRAGCTSLTQLTLLLGIEEIGAYALSSCTSLTDVYFEGSEEQAKMLPIGEGNEYLVRAHWHYRMDSEGNLESAVYWSLSEDGTLWIYGEGRMPDYSQDYSVPWHASQDKIRRVVVEKGVKNLGSYLFYGCKALTSVTLPDSLTAIGANAFDGCSTLIQVEVPQSVTSIGAGAFRNCTQLARVTLPSGKVKLGESAFSGCTTLKRLVLPDQLTEIPNYLLNGSGITGIVIPDAVTKIQYGAFSSCSALTSVTLPVSLEQIYDGAFSGAPVTDVYIAGSMADVALIQIALNNAPLQEATWHCSDADGPYPLLNGGTLTSGLTWKLVDGVLTISGSGVIPDFTSEFAAPWYVSRSDITVIVLEEGVRSIGNYAFRNCSQAAAVTLPESLIAIREHAFDGCSAL
ncbi:MAG: leucine-rich repeat domain-containing protein [Clostridia bacterium]|nr:leucine-rich repeat domain-containing protein [Clostridia bacterium]